MARVPRVARPGEWQKPAARIEGERLLKARRMEQRVMEAKAKVAAEAARVEEMEVQALDKKVDDLREQINRLTDNLPKIMPAAGGGRRMVQKILERDYEFPSGPVGDMQTSVYDPQGVEDDAFDRANHTGEQEISTVTGLQTELDGKQDHSAHLDDLVALPKTDAHFVTTDGDGFVSTTPEDAREALGVSEAELDARYLTGSPYQGQWNANTNSPAITSSVGTVGHYYIVSTAGTTTVDGISSWAVGDQIRFNGSVWQKIPNVNSVASVNGQTGTVVLSASDVGAQASDTELAAIAGLTSAADRLPYFTGSGTASLATFTSFGRSLVDDANAAAGRTTLEAAAIAANTFTAAQSVAAVALTDGATITPNLTLGNYFTVTLGGNRTLANPSSKTVGTSFLIVITQDGTGSRTLSFGTQYLFAGGSDPTLSTTAGAIDVISGYVHSSTQILCNIAKGFA